MFSLSLLTLSHSNSQLYKAAHFLGSVIYDYNSNKCLKKKTFPLNFLKALFSAKFQRNFNERKFDSTRDTKTSSFELKRPGSNLQTPAPPL